MESHCARQLFECVFRMLKSFARHRGVWMRPQIDVRVAQQGQDRVVERRGRDFDLTAKEGVSILRDDAAEQLELHFTQHPLVVLAEPTVL